MSVRAVHGMAAIGCVARATTVGVADMEIVATSMAIEMAEVNVALSGAQER
jgi:hypothetical protein